MVAPDLAAVVASIDELNAMCRELRSGYLSQHPDAPATARERELTELAIAVWHRHRRDMRPSLPPMPSGLRQRISAAIASDPT